MWKMFYTNFDRICKSKGTSASASAKAIGLGASTPASWKMNGNTPKRPVLEALAAHLGCDVSDFFRNEAGVLVDETEYRIAMDEGNYGTQIPHDGNIAEFIKIYNACSNRQKHQLMDAVYDFEDKVLKAEQDYC